MAEYRSKRDRQLANNEAHRWYGLLADKPPMVQEVVAPKRVNKPRAADAPPLEHEEQVAVIQWWHHFSKTIGLDYRQLVAVPNGQMMFWAARNPNALLGYLHAEGMRDGMMDLVLFHAAREYHGLCIEMKRMNAAKPKPQQLEMNSVLSGAGYRCIVCYGANAAIDEIKEYCEK